MCGCECSLGMKWIQILISSNRSGVETGLYVMEDFSGWMSRLCVCYSEDVVWLTAEKRWWWDWLTNLCFHWTSS